jgi:hypothetical protein
VRAEIMQASSSATATICNLPPILDVFVQRADELNRQFGEPITESRVVNTAKSVFQYVETGQLRTGEHGAGFKRLQAQELARDPYLRLAEGRERAWCRIPGRRRAGRTEISRLAERLQRAARSMSVCARGHRPPRTRPYFVACIPLKGRLEELKVAVGFLRRQYS